MRRFKFKRPKWLPKRRTSPLTMRDRDVRKPRVTVVGTSYAKLELEALKLAKRRGIRWRVKPGLKIFNSFAGSGTAVSKRLVLLPGNWSSRTTDARARVRWHELEHCHQYGWGYRLQYAADERFRLASEVAAYAVTLITMKMAGESSSAILVKATHISRAIHERLKLRRISKAEAERWSWTTMMKLVADAHRP